MIKSEEHLGLFCNNHPVGKSGYIREMSICPATLKPVTMEIRKPVPGKVQSKPVKSTAKQLQDKTVRELAKLRSPGKVKKRVGQQTLGEIIEI
jgi:hypothetical protein